MIYEMDCARCGAPFNTYNPDKTLCRLCAKKTRPAVTLCRVCGAKLADGDGVCPSCRRKAVSKYGTLPRYELKQDGLVIEGKLLPVKLLRVLSICARFTVTGRTESKCAACKARYGSGKCLFIQAATETGIPEPTLLKLSQTATEAAYSALFENMMNTQETH